MRLETKYQMREHCGTWRHEWSAVGRRGAISVWITEGHKPGDEAYGVVEIHHRNNPPDYMSEDAPSQIKCDLLGEPCWHDGSSLAIAPWIASWDNGKCDNKKMLAMVEDEYKRRFNIEEDGK